MDKRQSSKPVEKKRYQGYDVKKTVSKQKSRKKPWFWKVLGISLLITLVIILITCAVALRRKKSQTDYLSKINGSNSLELLLEDHSNVTITQSYTGLKDENDYKETRFLRETIDGESIFSYLKTEGLDVDYKEVLTGERLFRYDGSFTYFYGFVNDDYDTFFADVTADILQLDGSETVVEQTESTDRIKVTLTYNVQAGDKYTELYGFETGTEVQKVLVIDKDTLIVLSDIETVDGEDCYSYAVTFDGENKVPKFYREAKAKETNREITVYYDYQGDNEEKYSYTIPVDTYFTLLDHEGYTVYMDEDCLTEFTNSQMQIQNPYSDLTLYMKKD